MKKGSKMAPLQKLKISKAKQGSKYPNRKRPGPMLQETKSKISNSNKGLSHGPIGENHPRWNPDRASYFVLHNWVKQKLGTPSLCENCGVTKGWFDWANLSGQYFKKINDWARLCRRCHTLIDGIGSHLRKEVV